MQEFQPKDYEVANWFWSQNKDLRYSQVTTIALSHPIKHFSFWSQEASYPGISTHTTDLAVITHLRAR